MRICRVYLRIPVHEAIQYVAGPLCGYKVDNQNDVDRFAGGIEWKTSNPAIGQVPTPAGIVPLYPSDWLIRGVGELYVCKDGEFQEAYIIEERIDA